MASTAESAAYPAQPRSVSLASNRRMWIVALLLLIGIGGGGWYLLHRGIESTDDAQIDAELVAVPARIGGMVATVSFSENQLVKKGQLLAELDAAPSQLKLAEAEANLAAAEAEA